MVVQELSSPCAPVFRKGIQSNFALALQLQSKNSKHDVNANNLTLLPEAGKFINQETDMRETYIKGQ